MAQVAEAVPTAAARRLMLATLYVNVFLDSSSYGVVLPIVPFLAEQFNSSSWGVSLAIVSFSLARFIGNILLGLAADKFGKKVTLCCCMLSLAVFGSATGLAPSLPCLIALRAASGFGSAVMGIVQATVSVTVPREALMRHQGYVAAASGAGIAAGAALGGVVVDLMGLRAPFFVIGALCVLNLLALVVFVQEPRTEPKGVQSASDEATKSPEVDAAKVVQHSQLRRLPVYFATFSFWVATFGCESLAGLYFAQALNFSVSMVSFLFTLNGVVQLFCSALLVKRLSTCFGTAGSGVVVSVVSVAACAVAFVVAPWAPWVWAAVSAVGFSAGAVQAVLLSEMSTPQSRSTVMGINQAVACLGRIAGPLLSAAIYSVNPRCIWFLGIVFFVLAAFAFAFTACVRASTVSQKDEAVGSKVQPEADLEAAATPTTATSETCESLEGQ